MKTRRLLTAAAFFGVFGIAFPANSDDARETAAIEAANRFDFDHVSCNGAANEIRVIVTGVKRSEGRIIADMYPNNQDVFLRGRGRVKKVKYAARAPETKFCVPAPEAGLFAMAVYHDRNANGNFDKTGLGLPAEPWGLSNNPRSLFGPPPIEKTLFEVSADGATVEIELN